jgi:hypothetical protein
MSFSVTEDIADPSCRTPSLTLEGSAQGFQNIRYAALCADGGQAAKSLTALLMGVVAWIDVTS